MALKTTLLQQPTLPIEPTSSTTCRASATMERSFTKQQQQQQANNRRRRRGGAPRSKKAKVAPIGSVSPSSRHSQKPQQKQSNKACKVSPNNNTHSKSPKSPCEKKFNKRKNFSKNNKLDHLAMPSLSTSQNNVNPYNGRLQQQEQQLRILSRTDIVALDCEMVAVGGKRNISVLARCSIVDFEGNILLDKYCRTQERVTDYRTSVSGIRPQDLEGPNALPYGELRTLVQSVLSNKLLVGHGLENDLRVLNLKHPWHMIRDSASYPPLMRPGGLQPNKLRDLVWQELGMIIQQEGTAHDSIVDARASMDIFKRHQINWEYDIRNALNYVHVVAQREAHQLHERQQRQQAIAL